MRNQQLTNKKEHDMKDAYKNIRLANTILEIGRAHV